MLFAASSIQAQEYVFNAGLIKEQTKKYGVINHRGQGYDSFIALNQVIILDLNKKLLYHDRTTYRITTISTSLLKNGGKRIIVGLSDKHQLYKNLKGTFVITNGMDSRYIFSSDDFTYEYQLDLDSYRR